MSFPSAPEGSAAREPGQGFVLGPDDGEAVWWLGSLSVHELTRADSRGGVDIVDHRVPAVVSELGEPAAQLVLPGPDVGLPEPARIAAVAAAHGIHGAE